VHGRIISGRFSGGLWFSAFVPVMMLFSKTSANMRNLSRIRLNGPDWFAAVPRRVDLRIRRSGGPVRRIKLSTCNPLLRYFQPRASSAIPAGARNDHGCAPVRSGGSNLGPNSDALVKANTGGRDLGILGEPGVNALQLNIALDIALDTQDPYTGI
jgi:hypothetical protein